MYTNACQHVENFRNFRPERMGMYYSVLQHHRNVAYRKMGTCKILVFLIPIYNIYLSFLLYRDIAAKYGKGDNAYAIGLLLLPFIFFPLLAFKETPIEGVE